jgi:flagellar biosynthesis GTPase FlhF
MSRSTPIANLPNLQKRQSGGAFEQRENQIVKEILNEIDNDAGKQSPQQAAAQQAAAQQAAAQQAAAQQEAAAAQEHAMIQQQMLEQQLMEQQMLEQQQQAAFLGPMKGLETVVPTAEPKSFMDEMLDLLKPSILVGIIVAVLSLPVVGEMISKVVASKESLKKFEMPIMLLVKAVVGGALFYGGSTTISL